MKAPYRLLDRQATVRRSLWVTLCALVLVWPDMVGAATLRGRAHVDDGDSLRLNSRKIRLFGVDAFEYDQTCGRTSCGRQALKYLQRLAEGRAVTCVRQDIDSYGRVIAICRLADGRDLGQEMVRAGHALAYRRFSTRYVAEEAVAKTHRRGAWAHGFREPSTYRRATR